MELKRKIYDELLEWKNSKIKSALLIEGARRIGKSTIEKKIIKKLLLLILQTLQQK